MEERQLAMRKLFIQLIFKLTKTIRGVVFTPDRINSREICVIKFIAYRV